jgi:hypothetical protein
VTHRYVQRLHEDLGEDRILIEDLQARAARGEKAIALLREFASEELENPNPPDHVVKSQKFLSEK